MLFNQKTGYKISAHSVEVVTIWGRIEVIRDVGKIHYCLGLVRSGVLLDNYVEPAPGDYKVQTISARPGHLLHTNVRLVGELISDVENEENTFAMEFITKFLDSHRLVL